VLVEVSGNVALAGPDLVEDGHHLRQVLLDDRAARGFEDRPIPLFALSQLRLGTASPGDVRARADVLGHRSRRVDHGMAPGMDDANRSVGEDEPMVELVVLPLANRRGDRLLDALPILRMNDVPVPGGRRFGIRVIETDDLEVLRRWPGVAANRRDPAPRAAEPLHLGQECLPAPQLRFDSLPFVDFVL
jgi:hypothetical protein